MKIIKAIIVTMLLQVPVFAGEADELMLRANQLYQEDKFDEAIIQYETILNNGLVSPKLYYNLGNSYYRMGHIGKAILNYERALKLDPGNEDVEYNISIVKARTIDNIREVPKLFIVEWWEGLLAALSTTTWLLIVVAVYIVLLIFLGIYFTGKTGRLQRLGFLGGSLSFAALLISVILLVSHLNRITSTEYGVLIEEEYVVKQSPSSSSNDAFIVHEGLKFSIEDRVDDWTLIRLSDGKVGWLPTNTFEII
jgi:tetratricopeptide (TPR) repeat protein